MFNMHSKKTKQRVASVIVILLVVAMILPILSYFG